MKTFEYRGYDMTGQFARGLVEGLDVKDARERLTSRGILAERLVPATEQRVRGVLARGGGFGLERRATLYREMAALLNAGLPLAQALDVLIQAPEQDDDAVRLAGVRDRIREGVGFSDAWIAVGREVSAFEKAVLLSGERAGNLGEVLDLLATYLDDQHQLRESVTTALMYPSFVLGLAILVAIAMFGFILPGMEKLFAQSAMQLPWLTRMLMSAGRYGIPVILPAILLCMVGAYVGWNVLRKDPVQRERLEQFLFRMPGFGKGYRLLVNVRFAQTMSLLLRGGVGIVEAIELAGAATGSAWLATRLKEEARAVRDGTALAHVLRNIPPLSGTLPGWIHAGEVSGNLQAMLSRAGQRFEHQWRIYIRRVTVIIEPALILIVAVIVLVVALAVLMPILQMNKAM